MSDEDATLARVEAIAAKVRTMRALEAYGGRGQDPLGMSPGYVVDASASNDRLVDAAGVAQYVFDEYGGEPALRVLLSIAFLTLETDPDGFAAALHLIHGRRIDIPALLAGCWFFDDAASTWEAVQELLTGDTGGSR